MLSIKSSTFNLFSLLIIGLLFAACDKKKDIVASWDVAGNSSEYAHIRVVHASPNFRTINGQPDSLNIFVGNSKINGVRLSYGSIFPGLSPATYAAVKPGSTDIRVSVAGIVNIDSVLITNMSQNLEKGQFYSLIITDSLKNASKDSTRIFVKDSFLIPSNGRISLRLMHAMVDTGTDQRVDVFSARRNANIYSGVRTGTVTSFSNQPFIDYPDTLIVRRVGTTTELARINNITFSNTRTYTLLLRGVVNVTGTKAKSLTYFANR